ncbi:MAG: hypothetical protein JXQ75_22580 [Phycisphaerae bacterium]|nr:hypothetical protein [Phycisphaerae bacterium]
MLRILIQRAKSTLIVQLGTALLNSPIFGDFNGDGRVDRIDLASLVDSIVAWSIEGQYSWMADLNADGAVDTNDLDPLLANLGNTHD